MRNLGAKVQQKMHICKKIARKFTFRCDLLWFLVISIQKYAALRLLQKYSKITDFYEQEYNVKTIYVN